MKVRLQKYLADAGVASRRKCEELIAAGNVLVNGRTAVIGDCVEEGDVVELFGKRIEPVSRKAVYAFYKPKNVICTASDTEDRVKVLDYFKDVPLRLYTAGRLDFDSEGLIFVTNDGEFADKLMHPRNMKNKTYRVLIKGALTAEEKKKLEEGVMLEDGLTAPAAVEIEKIGRDRTELYITIHEGRNRQVRRMLEAVGHSTLRLCRTSIGTVRLDGMRPGEKRQLTDEEIRSLIGEN